MIRLGVNIDHIATVRQARRGKEPDPVWAAVQAELGGADLITVHLREDRRHIQDRDVRLLKETIKVPLNLEMATVDEIVRIAIQTKPEQATLVPEKREEVTTEGGLDVVAHERAVARVVKQLQDQGISVALFIDPDLQQIEVAKLLGVAAVELQTASYSEAKTPKEVQLQFTQLAEAARQAHERGLHVHMGHGLNLKNVVPIAAIPQVEELNIGHSIVSRALFVGLERAVREMREVMNAARSG